MHAYYKACPSQNPLVTDRINKRNSAIHKKKLQNTRHSVDNKPPCYWRTMPKRNLKKEQMQEERYSKIERENRQLLEKMAKIMQEDHELSAKAARLNQMRAQTPKSLNIVARKREMTRITQQNALILDRLQKSEPTYSALAWELERRQHEDLIHNMAFHKSAQRPKTAKTKKIVIKKTKSLPVLERVRPSTAPGMSK
jgi:hypothetical protein